MKYMLTSWTVAAAAFLIAAFLLPQGFEIKPMGLIAATTLPKWLEPQAIFVDRFAVAALAALALGIANALVRPIVVLFAFPLTIMTLGLLLFVINGAMLWLVTLVLPGKVVILHFGYAVAAALIISTINTVAGWVLK